MILVKRIAFVAVLTAPLAAWAFIKPLRVLAPEWAGVNCYADSICTDESSRLAEATALRSDAVHVIEGKVGTLEHIPRMIFCSSKVCERSFGFGKNASYNVGTVGMVISTRGWQAHYIRHELIHHVQAERLGALRLWFSTPKWFIEGMAYSLSEDPKRPLAEPFESYRVHYEQWATTVPVTELWSRAKAL